MTDSRARLLESSVHAAFARDLSVEDEPKYTTEMENSRGFMVIPQCVSVALVKQLATEFDVDIAKRKPTVCREKYNEYEVSSLGIAVRDDFVKVWIIPELISEQRLRKKQNVEKGMLEPLFSTTAVPHQPTSINMGIFHQTHADPSKLKTANEEEVYITIAVTDLGQENGWFTLYEGSHQRKPPIGNPVDLNLKAGDAVAWSGRIVYSHTSGGGGKFITLVYRLRTA